MTEHDYGKSVGIWIVDEQDGVNENRMYVTPFGPIEDPPRVFTNADGRADFEGTPGSPLLFGANIIDTPDPARWAVSVEDGCAIVTSSTGSWTYRLSPAHWADGTADEGLYVGRWPD